MEIQFGFGATEYLKNELIDHKSLIITSIRGRRLLQDSLRNWRIAARDVTWFEVARPYMSLEEVEQAAMRIPHGEFDQIVAFGGGSVIDFAKLILGLAKYAPDQRNLRLLLSQPDLLSSEVKIPFVAIPTTFGSGSEVTPTATVWDMKTKSKLSLDSLLIQPTLALIDPANGRTMPVRVAWDSSLDALVHLLDAIWNVSASKTSRESAISELPVATQNLAEFRGKITDEFLATAANSSLQAGLAISQSRTSICHALSYPLTLQYGIPHGTAVAFTAPSVARLSICRAGEVFEGLDADFREELPMHLRKIIKEAGVHDRVRAAVGTFEQLVTATRGNFSRGRLENYPVSLQDAEVLEILKESFDAD